MKKLLLTVLTGVLALTLTGCGDSETTTKDIVKPSEWRTPGQLIQEYKTDDIDDATQFSRAKMTLEFSDSEGNDYIGYMEFVLFDTLAPITVENFKTLAEDGFYDNLTITRVVTNVCIQGGDPKKVADGGEEKEDATTIEGEFESNDYKNYLSHRRGVISMARVDKLNDSASSQFFVVDNDFTSCDGNYAAFGWLDEYDKTAAERKHSKIDGKIVLYDYDCLDKVANLDLLDDSTDSEPTNQVKIVKVEIVK